MRVIIAAAGTGGHINPGIAIANKIKKEEPDSEIIFIGTKTGIENDLVKRAGYELKSVDSYGFSKKLTPKNIKNTLKTLNSINDAKKIIKEFKPDVVIGTGGYICVTVCGAARRMKIPFIIHESNVLPGKATRLFAREASKILVGFKEAKEKLPHGTNVAVTGTPIKGKNLNYDTETKELKKKEMGFESKKPLVLIFGGSQGSKSINSAMKDIVISRVKNNDSEIKDRENFNTYQIVWATGPNNYDEIKKEFDENGIKIESIEGIKVLPYIYNMDEIMNFADLLVCRSGAMTVTELEEMGKPAILIPYPYAAENHQEYNARALENAGAGKVILDKDLNDDILNDTINGLISDENKLKEMSEKSKALSIKNVEDVIYAEIKECLSKKE